MSDESGDPLPSLTRQLRELHQRLDPQAPRFLSNGKRKTAIQALLAGDDGGSSGGEETAANRSATRSPRPRPATPRRSAASGSPGRREVGGVKLPAAPPKPASDAKRPAERNVDRLWRYLFG